MSRASLFPMVRVGCRCTLLALLLCALLSVGCGGGGGAARGSAAPADSGGSSAADSGGSSAAGGSGETVLPTTAETPSPATAAGPPLVALSITPVDASVPVGFSRPFHVTGIFSDSTTQDLTGSAAWSSSSPVVAAASGPPGVFLGVATGQAVIKAEASGLSATTTLTVTSATLTSVAVTPPSLALARGTDAGLAAVALFSDSSTLDVTGSAAWASSNESVCTVSKGQAHAAGLGSATATAAIDGMSGSSSVLVTAATLTAIQVTPSSATSPVGLSVSYAATGTFSDGSVQDLTQWVQWSSKDPSVATISGPARALAVSPGATVISATDAGTGINGSASLTVTTEVLQSIALTPLSPTIPSGFQVEFNAIGTYSDGTLHDVTDTATWTSSDPRIAVVSNVSGVRGQAVGLAPGATTITAVDPSTGTSASTTLNVSGAVLQSLVISPPAAQAAAGTSVQYSARGIFSDGSSRDVTDQLTWSVSPASVAAMSAASGRPGEVVALSPGTAAVGAISPASSVSASVPLTVTAAVPVSVTITPSQVSLPLGHIHPMKATVVFSDNTTQDVTASAGWTTSDATVCTVSNVTGSQGYLQTLKTGSATVTAVYSGLTGSCAVSVTSAVLVGVSVAPFEASSAVGVAVPFTATGLYSDSTTMDLTQTVHWTTGDPAVATVSNSAGSQGVAAPMAVGSTSVTATDANTGLSGSATLDVTDAVLLSLTVGPSDASLQVGATLDFQATGTWSDGTVEDLTADVIWSSSNSAAATISSDPNNAPGRATGRGAGTTTITAVHLFSGRQASQPLTVTAPVLQGIVLTPAALSLPKGTSRQFTATGYYSDGSGGDLTHTVTWQSSAPSVASISGGLLSANAPGQAIVSATDPATGVAATAQVTVTNAVLVSIAVAPADATVPARFRLQYVAIGTFSDGTTADLSRRVTWKSSKASVLSVGASTGSARSGKKNGSATVTATDPVTGLQGATGVSVNPALGLVSLVVLPDNQVLAVGATLLYRAIATFTDSSTLDLTQSASWSVRKKGVADVSDAVGTRGLVTALRAGTATVQARFLYRGVFNGQATLTVP